MAGLLVLLPRSESIVTVFLPPCHDDPEAWFRTDSASIAAAKAECRRCPIRSACEALGADEPYGVFGGLSADDRREVQAATFLLSGFPEPPHDRTRYCSGCRCDQCEASNTAYVARWRRDRPVTAGPSIDPEDAVPGQLAIALEMA